MTDRLEALLAHFPLSAHLAHAGPVAGVNVLPVAAGEPQLHLIGAGTASVVHDNGELLRIDAPSLLLYTRAQPHRFQVDAGQPLSLVTAQLGFDASAGSPLADALPTRLCLPLSTLKGSRAVLDLLFEEASANYCGRQAMLGRLFEMVLIQLLRTLMENGQIQVGLLAGMGHPRLRHALVAMHEQPGADWSLRTLAGHAGMSRSRFAAAFREVVGTTPGSYLQGWRTRLAQQALRRGQPLKRIASEIGYASEAALSRAFRAQTGQSPRQWKAAGAPAHVNAAMLTPPIPGRS